MTLPENLNKETVKQLCCDGLLSSKEPVAITEKTTFDDVGMALTVMLIKRGRLTHIPATVQAQLDAHAKLLTVEKREKPKDPQKDFSKITKLGANTCAFVAGWGAPLTYLGEVLISFFTLGKGRFRWGDCRLAFCRCGAQAVPVVCLIGFLLGLILAFQSAIPLEMFGAEGFVGGLVGIALVRELGLVITAILMAGRTGSAFAAELGTMQVNEEIDALETMGLHPVRFLALPRIVAGTLALPFLSLFATAAGLVGGWVVMLILGFPLSYYIDQLQAFVALGDLIGSLAKAFIFGFMVASVGCWFGLRAGRDAGAVGTATTAAVVTGIVLLTILEGLFAVIFYAMGW